MWLSYLNRIAKEFIWNQTDTVSVHLFGAHQDSGDSVHAYRNKTQITPDLVLIELINLVLCEHTLTNWELNLVMRL